MESNTNSLIERKPTAFAAGMIYLIVLILLMVSSFLAGRYELKGNDTYIVMFVIQIVTILLPPLLYLMIKKIKIKKTIRLNRISLSEFFLTIGMAVFGYGAVIPINLVWAYILSKIGTPQAGSLPEMYSPTQYLLALLVIAVTPAIVEEFLVRGVMMRGYEKYGTRTSIVLTGALFALLHLSIVSLPAIILMGIILCYIVYRSNSLFTGIIYHLTNNAIAVTLVYMTSIFNQFIPTGEETVESIADIPDAQMVLMIIIVSIMGLIALALFGACFAGFIRITREKHRAAKQAKIEAQKAAMADADTVQPVTTRLPRFVELIPTFLAILIIVGMLVLEVLRMANLV
ncbi:MAG TPA: type II CAAX endopeptidase family protein [Bacillota bacterium]|nr:type II CAAX endopeptidase family protein [Bacillota bacterium]